jgi:hypothetical protein
MRAMWAAGVLILALARFAAPSGAATIEECNAIADANRRVACYRTATAGPPPSQVRAAPGAQGASPPDAGSAAVGLVLIAAGGAVYFAPWVVAAARGARSVNGIAVLNLFLGWTLLGWVAALVWAVSDRRDAPGPKATSADRAATAPRSVHAAEPDGRSLLRAAIARDARRAGPPDRQEPEPPAARPATVRALTPEQEALVRSRARRAYPCAIAGLAHAGADGRPRADLVRALPVGAVLRLLAEPGNPHDPDAVGVWRDGAHLGYVPMRHGWVAEALDEGDDLAAVLSRVEEREDGSLRAVMLVLVLGDGEG